MKCYIVQTEREYEGSWVEKVYLTRKEAEHYLEQNKQNDELKIREHEPQQKETFITLGTEDMIFFDVRIDSTTIDIDYHFTSYVLYLGEENPQRISSLISKLDKFYEIKLNYERRLNSDKTIQKLKDLSEELGLVFALDN